MKSKDKKIVFSAILLLGLLQNITAQLNESDTMKLQLQISLTGNYQKGNVELLTLISRNEFLIRPFPNWAFKTQLSSYYTKFSDGLVDPSPLRNFLDIGIRQVSFRHGSCRHKTWNGREKKIKITCYEIQICGRYSKLADSSLQRVKLTNYILTGFHFLRKHY